MFKKALFFSDIHITSNQDPKYLTLLDHIKTVNPQNVSHLFLLGDIFDLWIADRQFFLNQYNELIEELQNKVKQGIKLYYFEGNHDLYLKKFWQNEVGAIVCHDALDVQLGGQKFHLEHGDQMDPEDRGYLFLRWFLRTPLMKWVAYNIPEKWIVKLGEWSSKKSRQYTSEVKTIQDDQSTKKMLNHAHKVYKKKPFDVFVCGHTHVQYESKVKMYNNKETLVINLGSWYDHPKYFEFTTMKNYQTQSLP